jgi:hypothetical protein
MIEADLTGGVVRILGSRPENQPVYSWLNELKRPWEAVSEYDASWLPPADTALLVTHRHYSPIETSVLRRTLTECQVPVLVLADGILEWRNTWMNPQVTPACFFQPVLGHKIACLGAAQARTISSWGNPGKCEVVGLPRLDRFLNRVPKACPPRSETASSVKADHSHPLRLLVMTARTPGFTPEQLEITLTSLQDLKSWVDSHSDPKGLEIEVTWRLTGNLAEQLGVINSLNSSDNGSEIERQLIEADAVVTTASTTILEAALLGKPVAVLDYHGTPNYLTPAWSIRHQGDFSPVLRELAAPPLSRMLFQQQMLHDQLECQTPATPRMIRLVEAMVQRGCECRREGIPLKFSQALLAEESAEDRAIPRWNSQRPLIEQDWATDYLSEDRLNQLAMAQYGTLDKEYQALRKLHLELRSTGASQARKLARLEEKRNEQDVRIERLQGRIKELRERVQKLKSFNEHHLEAWQQNRKAVVEALGEEWVVAHWGRPDFDATDFHATGQSDPSHGEDTDMGGEENSHRPSEGEG